MKKSIAVFMALILVFSLSACKSEKAPEPKDQKTEAAQQFPLQLFSDDKYTVTALSYSTDSYGNYGLELKFENKTDAKANINYDGYIIANGYALTGLVNIKTEPGETSTGWLTLNSDDMEIRGLKEEDIVQIKVQLEAYLPDSGDTVKLGDGYSAVQFGAFSEDKIPAASVGTQVVMDRDGIVVKLVKSEVDWSGDKAYYFCIENNTDKSIKFSTFSATVNGGSQCDVVGTSRYSIPAGTKSVEKLAISEDNLAKIELTPETVTSITTSFRFFSEDSSLDFTSDSITINE